MGRQGVYFTCFLGGIPQCHLEQQYRSYQSRESSRRRNTVVICCRVCVEGESGRRRQSDNKRLEDSQPSQTLWQIVSDSKNEDIECLPDSYRCRQRSSVTHRFDRFTDCLFEESRPILQELALQHRSSWQVLSHTDDLCLCFLTDVYISSYTVFGCVCVIY